MEGSLMKVYMVGDTCDGVWRGPDHVFSLYVQRNPIDSTHLKGGVRSLPSSRSPNLVVVSRVSIHARAPISMIDKYDAIILECPFTAPVICSSTINVAEQICFPLAYGDYLFDRLIVVNGSRYLFKNVDSYTLETDNTTCTTSSVLCVPSSEWGLS